MKIVLIALVFLFSLSTAQATELNNPKYASIIVDMKSSSIVHEVNAFETRHPASLTKMMTLYLLFEQLKQGNLTLESPLTVSVNASMASPTKIGVKPSSTIKVRDAILCLIVKSSNDVAVVVAENLSGSVEGFAQLMTDTSKELGMRNTIFRNPHGLPDVEQITTAFDMAVLGIRLYNDFPEYFHYFSTKEFTYQGRTYHTHNRMLDSYPGTNGIKTGFINMSGFNIVTSVQYEDMHLIGVVMGMPSWLSRNNHMASLLFQETIDLTTTPEQIGRKPAEFNIKQGDF